MDEHVYRIIEVTGSSKNSYEEAVRNAVARAGKNLRQLRWFEVVETRGTIGDDGIDQWQVTVKIGFRLED